MANGVTSTYALDLAGGLPQVLSDGANTYLYGLGRIAQQSAGGSEYFLADALGSVRQLVDASGTIAGTQSFDPYGNLLDSSGTLTNYGFAGEWTDDTGLQYLRARYYSSLQGRFITQDPFFGVLTQPALLTPYQYAFNNPVLRTDPSGKFVDTLFDIASVGYDIYTIADKNNRGCAVSWSDWAALGLDAFSLAIPFLPAGGMVFRFAAHADDLGNIAHLIDKSDDVIQLAARMENVREVGRTGELLAGITKNTERVESITQKAAYRIPDALNHTEKVIQEVKNVNNLSYTKQLRDFVAYSKKYGYEFDLIIRENTTLSESLITAIKNGDIFLKRKLP